VIVVVLVAVKTVSVHYIHIFNFVIQCVQYVYANVSVIHVCYAIWESFKFPDCRLPPY